MAVQVMPPPAPPRRGLLRRVLVRLIYPFLASDRPAPQTPTGFFTDTSICIGCKACEVACKEWNRLPADGMHWSGNSYDNTDALSATSWRHVKFVEQFPANRVPLELLSAPPPPGRWLMMSDVCKHCATAPCHTACPTGAIIQNEFTNIFIQPDICNGCAYCIAACPFGVITRSGADGHAHKCTLCYDRQRSGLVPACAKACPTGSIAFGPVEELRARARRRVTELQAQGVADARLYGDRPGGRYLELHSFYLLLDHPTVYGLPDEPVDPWLRMNGDYFRSAVAALTSIAALVAVLLFGALEMQTNRHGPAGTLAYADREVTKPPTWHGLVAWDMMLNGLATGLFLVAGLAELVSPDTYGPVAAFAYPIALVILLADLACLVLDLGDPLRFHHMMRVFKPRSPMSVGVWSLTAFSLPATVAAGLSLLPAEGVLEWVRRLTVALGLLPALGSAVYKGVLFSTSAQPVWKEARWLGGYLATSAITLGCAGMLGLAVLMGHERAAAGLRPAVCVLLVVGVIPMGLLLRDVRAALRRLRLLRQMAFAGVLAFGGGVLLPLAMLLLSVDVLSLGGRPADRAGERGHAHRDCPHTPCRWMMGTPAASTHRIAFGGMVSSWLILRASVQGPSPLEIRGSRNRRASAAA
jgi:formate dehydrogenase iron-sulfur subunit